MTAITSLDGFTVLPDTSRGRRSLFVYVHPSGNRLSTALFEALGRPESIEILMNDTTGTVAIRPSDHGVKVSPRPGAHTFHCRPLVIQFVKNVTTSTNVPATISVIDGQPVAILSNPEAAA